MKGLFVQLPNYFDLYMGVPQGPTIGSLLFLLFIIDVSEVIPELAILFAEFFYLALTLLVYKISLI